MKEYNSNKINCYSDLGWRYSYPHLLQANIGVKSHYGTINQVGNLGEWCEGNFGKDSNWKLFLGGSLIRPMYSSKMNYVEGDAPDKSIASVGFRIIKLLQPKNVLQTIPPSKVIRRGKNEGPKSNKFDPNGGIYVHIEDQNNIGDIYNKFYGTVGYEYEISKYELTNAEYARFLSSVCTHKDTFSLFNDNMEKSILGGIKRIKQGNIYMYIAKKGWEKKPIVYLSFYSLCRYANWLHYGCPKIGYSEMGTTEGDKDNGAYDTRNFEEIKLGKKKPNKQFIKRNNGAKYFIPNNDEWYKAAYYDPTIIGKNKYHIYPTRNSTPPLSSEANYMINNSLVIGPPFYLCNVDSFSNSSSYYRTCNQGGNVWEWIEGWQYNKVGNIALRGGSFSYTEYGLASLNEDPGGINDISYVFGGRLARIDGQDGYSEKYMTFKNLYFYMITFMLSDFKFIFLWCVLIFIAILIIVLRKYLFKIYCKTYWVQNIIIWLLRRNKCRLNVGKRRKGLVLIVPCDPWSVFGSRGDEAMLIATISQLKEVNPDVSFIFVVANQKAYEEVKARGYEASFSWKGKSPFSNILDFIEESKPEQVIILGADCMDGYYGKLVSFTLFAIADSCCRNALDYKLLGFSFNEYPVKSLKLPYMLCSNKLKFCLRDEYSLKRFRDFTGKNPILVSDSAFLLKPNAKFNNFKTYETWVNNKKKLKQLVIGFNYHPMLAKNQSENLIKQNALIISENLVKLLRQNSVINILFIPHDNRGHISDNMVLPIVAEYLKCHGFEDRINEIEMVYHADEIKAITGLCDIVFCSRMHLAIASLGMGVPVVAATYQGKFEGLFRHFGFDSRYLMTQSELCSEKLVSLLNEMIKEHLDIKEQIKGKLKYVNELSNKNFIA